MHLGETSGTDLVSPLQHLYMRLEDTFSCVLVCHCSASQQQHLHFYQHPLAYLPCMTSREVCVVALQ